MKLNLKSWHATLYLSLYKELPNTLCPYFWKLILAIVLLPITWVGYIIPNVREEKNAGLNALLTLVTYMVAGMGFMMGQKILEPTDIWMQILASVLGVITFLGAVALFWTSVYLLFKLYDFIKEYIEMKQHERYMERVRSNVPPKQYIVSEWWKGFKDKYCPRIEWNK